MPFIDLHCDTIMGLMEAGPEVMLKNNNLKIDVSKLKAGGALAQFFALFIDIKECENPLEYGLKMLDRFYNEIENNSADLALALNYQDFRRNSLENRISAFLTIEEGGVLKGEMANLRNFYRLGVRLITLTWNYPNELGFPNIKEEYRSRGLTPFGCAVVSEMNRLGMIIDVSHLSDQGFYDVARLSSKPFVASHSNARSVTNHSRNLTDDMIRVLAEKGGVVGINFARDFLGSQDISRINDMVKHIKHIIDVGGIETAAVGSDFDGIDPELEIIDFSEMKKLADALEQNNFNSGQIDKICHANALRVIKDCL
ncbi:MAG: membrane dipeptidase [Veillonellaceae bacterium]|nr:membrane dipeptidase [Veillonellaceae bacterium]